MRLPFALRLYLALTWLLSPMGPALLRRRLARAKEDPARLDERLGSPGTGAEAERPDGPLIWCHGASIGEAMSILPLARELLNQHPGLNLLVTTGTVTSARRLAPLLPERARHRFVPLDLPGAVDGFLDSWRPDLAIWVESEIWPRLITRTAARNIPMLLLNARISEKSARGWAYAPAMARFLFGQFMQIVAQDHATVERLTGLGVAPAKLRYGGNLKSIATLAPPDPHRLSALRDALRGRPVWLASSTHPGEEEILLDAHRQLGGDALLILAPRHPERGEALASMIATHGLQASRDQLGELPRAEDRVFLADTLGQMALWLAVAPMTFVGGSLAPRGGHTPFEPAAAQSVILHGPSTENFEPAYTALAEADGAIPVSSAEELACALARLFADETARAGYLSRARVLDRLVPDIAALASEALALLPPAETGRTAP